MAGVNLTPLPEQRAEVAASLKKAEALLKEAIIETRRASHELVPVLLKDFGLQKAIEEFCNRYAGTSIQLQCHCFEERLAAPLEMAIYRISQELVTNLVKHSGASNASLEVYRDKDYVYIEVQDNGKGMPTSKGMTTDKGKETVQRMDKNSRGAGIGLKTIQDRVTLLEGTLIAICLPILINR